MIQISNRLAMIINLSNTALWHHKNCRDPHCNVSIVQLKNAAEYLKCLVDNNEIPEAQYYIDLMPNM
jgi:hypothetical protein